MFLVEIFLIGLALSMDAFAVSISCGLKIDKNYSRKIYKVAVFFGVFQALMPIIGYFFGNVINQYIPINASIIAFAVFMILGLKSLKEAFEKDESACASCICAGFKCISMFAVATSIDALLVGIVFAVKGTNIWLASLTIGVTTFLISLLGAYIGHYLSSHWGKKSGFLASALLILLAIKQLF